MTRVALPLVEPSSRLKLVVRRAVGHAACLLRPTVARRLAAADNPQPLTGLERVMLAALRQRAQLDGTLEEFTARQQRRFWSSAAAADFHAGQEQYFEEWFLGHNLALLTELRRVLGTGDFGTLCEIGCGTGRALAFLRGELPHPRRFIGIDLSAEQIRRNEERFGTGNVTWVAGDALAWILANGRPGWAYLCNNGVLEYFTQGEVRQLLAHLAGHLRPALTSLCEPIGVNHDLASEPGSMPYGSEHSFSHNYPHLLREAGFQVLYSSEFRRGQLRLLRVLARAG